MLVCPHCRGENAEEARFCNRCGRELEPLQTAMVSRPQSEGAVTELDMPPPKSPSPVFGVVMLVVLGLAIAGGATWWVLRPSPAGESAAADRCVGKFESPLNPYCVEVPEGWRGRTIRTATGALDVFTPIAEEDIGVAVRAGTVVPGVTTGLYAQEIRSTQETAGLSLTDVEGIRVGSEVGATWDFAARDQEGSLVQVRHVVVVRGEVGWRITLEGDRESFEEAALPFQQMLATWTFNYPEPQVGPGQPS